jgi:2-polyprenyl-3-methyl-5-hydroxy-6-metoxy-1,4-benzoquinol methylase
MSEYDVASLYERHAREYDGDRDRSLRERWWLDRFIACVRPGGTVLDLGCGMAEPIGRYLIEQGLRVVGVDASQSMIRTCRVRFPESEWLVADMRKLELDRRFDGVLAWDSFFHLNQVDQRSMFPRFASHLRRGAPLLFTSGPAESEVVGMYCSEPLYHASLSPEEYRVLLAGSGFTEKAHKAEDAECGGHTVWLATHDAVART